MLNRVLSRCTQGLVWLLCFQCMRWLMIYPVKRLRDFLEDHPENDVFFAVLITFTVVVSTYFVPTVLLNWFIYGSVPPYAGKAELNDLNFALTNYEYRHIR